MADGPSYGGVFLTFARNSLVRDMTFRSNFIIDAITSLAWMGMNLGFYILVYQYTPTIGTGSEGPGDPGWGQYQFFVFIATTVLDQQRGAGLLHAQRRRIWRTDPHRQSRFRPVEAGRHAVPRLAAKDRMVGAVELHLRRRAVGLFAVPVGLLAQPGAVCAVSIVPGSAASPFSTA